VTSSGIEPAAFQLVAYCLDQLRYSVPNYQEEKMFDFFAFKFYGPFEA
jgi:hypothetical protein